MHMWHIETGSRRGEFREHGILMVEFGGLYNFFFINNVYSKWMNDFECLFPLGAQSESSLKEAKLKSVAI